MPYSPNEAGLRLLRIAYDTDSLQLNGPAVEHVLLEGNSGTAAYRLSQDVMSDWGIEIHLGLPHAVNVVHIPRPVFAAYLRSITTPEVYRSYEERLLEEVTAKDPVDIQKLATTLGVPPVAVEAIADGMRELKVLPDGKVHRWS